MSELATVKQIAQALGLTPQAIRDKARNGQWEATAKVGKTAAYHPDNLPLPADERRKIKDFLVSQRLDKAIAELPEPACELTPKFKAPPAVIEKVELPSMGRLKGWQRRTMDARGALLVHLEELAEQYGLNRSIEAMIEAAKGGALPPALQKLVPQANARGGQCGKRTLSRTTLLRWRRELAAAEGNPVALAPVDTYEDPRLPQHRREKKEPEWAALFLKCYRKPSKPSVNDAREEMEALLPVGMTLPSESQCRRYLKRLSTIEREKGRVTGNNIRALKGFTRRSTDGLNPCAICQCDGHSVKARVAHPVHGKPFHPEVCAVIDAATRAVIGWSAGLSESNQTVADALRHACMITDDLPMGGIPAIFYTDPGSGNKAKVNSDELTGRYKRLGIDFKTGIPGNSQARGMVERLQQSLWIKMAKQMPTYTGKDMDSSALHKITRKVDSDIAKTGKSELLPSWPQFLDMCRQAVEKYNNRPHSSLPKITDQDGRRRHMTPAEAWAMHVNQGFEPPVLEDHELEAAFRPRIKVTVHRGEVRVFSNVYYDGHLVNYNGQEVFVDYEVQDASKVWVRDLEEQLICVARFEANKRSHHPLSEVEISAERRAARRRKLKENQINEIEMERHGTIEISAQQYSVQEIESLRKRLGMGMGAPEEGQILAIEPAEFKAPEGTLNRVKLVRSYDQKRKNGEALPPGASAWVDAYLNGDEYAKWVKTEREVEELQKEDADEK